MTHECTQEHSSNTEIPRSGISSAGFSARKAGEAVTTIGIREMVTPNINGHNWSDDDDDDAFSEPVVRSLADVEPVAVQWLWKGWIPLGKVTIFEGESDVGKSTVTLDWARIVSTGALWPVSVINGRTLKSQHPPSGVVLVGVEDGAADTVVPRLIATGADRRRIFTLLQPMDPSGNPVPFTIPRDIDTLRQPIREADAKLVVIDPITACIPENIDHGVDAAVRRVLMCLVLLADETGCAIVLIWHFNKSQGMNAKNRGGGSVAYSALVRSVIQAGQLPSAADDGATHGLTSAIANLSPKPASVGYRLRSALSNPELPVYEDEELSIAVVQWCGTVDFSADEPAGANGSDARKRSALRDGAKVALLEILSDRQAHPVADVRDFVELNSGAKQGTIDAAAEEMKLVKSRV